MMICQYVTIGVLILWMATLLICQAHDLLKTGDYESAYFGVVVMLLTVGVFFVLKGAGTFSLILWSKP